MLSYIAYMDPMGKKANFNQMQYLTLVRSAPLIVSYESYVLQGLNMDTIAIPHMSSGQKYMLNLRPCTN